MAEPSDTETGLDRVLDATVDSVLAFVAVWLVLTVVVRVTTNAVGSPTADATLQGVVALVACGCLSPSSLGRGRSGASSGSSSL